MVSSITALQKSLAYFIAANVTLKVLGNFTVNSLSYFTLYGNFVIECMLKILLQYQVKFNTCFTTSLTLILQLKSLIGESV